MDKHVVQLSQTAGSPSWHQNSSSSSEFQA